MALCKHPNVLRVNGAFVTDSKLYIVTPYLSAGEFMLQNKERTSGHDGDVVAYFACVLCCPCIGRDSSVAHGRALFLSDALSCMNL